MNRKVSEDISNTKEITELTASLHGLECPTCSSRTYTKNGTYKGNQRYKCKRCGKHYRSTSGNTVHNLHLKQKVRAYIECMNRGLSLRKTAKEIDISLRTAFRWRHRFLSAMEIQPAARSHKSNTVSAYILPYSSKTSKKSKQPQPNITSIIQFDTAGYTAIHVLGKYGKSIGQMAAAVSEKSLHIKSRSIPNVLKKESAFRLPKAHIVQNHKIHAKARNWLASFRGVASRYLENYWKWFTLACQLDQQKSPQAEYLCRCM